MPRKIYTREDIQKDLDIASKNKKSSENDLGNISKRLRKHTPAGTTNAQGALVISNKKEVETELTIEVKREYYSKKSFEQTFDTEVVQLISKAPIPIPPDDLEDPPPPPPTGLKLSCANYHWAMYGEKGVTEADLPHWKKNYHPLGNNPGGGYLVIPDDHPVFYIRNVYPKSERASFNYEWKVDGNLVSTKPFYHMFHAPDGGKGLDQWHKDNNPKHTHWRNQDDIVIECRVWNESGEMKQKVKMRCAFDVGSMSNRDEDGNVLPRWKWKGTRHFIEKNFYKGKGDHLTGYEMDPKFRNRECRIDKVRVTDFDTSNTTRPNRFKAPFHTDKQRLFGVDRPEKPPGKKVWFKTGHAIWNRGYGKEVPEHLKYLMNDAKYKAHKALHHKFEKEHPVELHSKYNPWNRWKDVFRGQIYLDGEWVTFRKFWSGYKVKDPNDLMNFMRTDEQGNYDRKGETMMERLGKHISISCPPLGNNKVTLGIVYGYRYSSLSDPNLKFKYYSKMVSFDPTTDDPDVIEKGFILEPEKIIFDKDVYDWEELEGTKEEREERDEFTKSEAIKSTLKIKKDFAKNLASIASKNRGRGY